MQANYTINVGDYKFRISASDSSPVRMLILKGDDPEVPVLELISTHTLGSEVDAQNLARAISRAFG